MARPLSLVILSMLPAAALAEEPRGHDAHVHGTGLLNIAVEGVELAMEFKAPGHDLVGFEHAASSPEDEQLIAAALASLEDPMSLFALPEAAGCEVTEVSARPLTKEESHHDHEGHDDHDDHGHEEHAHEEHGHDDHDEHARDDHDAHEDEAHEDHAHEAEEEADGYRDFVAEYHFTCAYPSALTEMGFPYFERFEGADKLEVQLVTDQGAAQREVTREVPQFDFGGAI
ncbi:MAG: DUF2796 domain-containing protein [Mangrovicoccus sp.]|nr:DUF2796 domain-containing protein [Mangrovicoccus sp.]